MVPPVRIPKAMCFRMLGSGVAVRKLGIALLSFRQCEAQAFVGEGGLGLKLYGRVTTWQGTGRS